jgi:hypothetical protein
MGTPAAMESASASMEPATSADRIAAMEPATAVEFTAAMEAVSAVESAAVNIASMESFPTMEIAAAIPVSPMAVEASPVPISAAPVRMPIVSMEPWPGSDEHAVNKPLRAIVSVRRACIRVIRVVAVSANRRRPHRNHRPNSNPHAHPHLRIRLAHRNE